MKASDFIAEWNSASDFIIAHTSGSTGKPKEIRLPKNLVADSARRTIDFFRLTADSRLHLCLSPEYIAGKMMIVRALLCGGRLTMEEASNRPCTDMSSAEKIDLMAVVPSQLESMLSRSDLPQIGALLVGGSAIPSGLRMKLAESGIPAFETYGMTETASHVALRRITRDSAEPFRALPGIKFSLDREEALRIDVPGMERIVTRDCAELIDFRTFRLRGRLDNAIITGGLKVHPELVEAKIGILLTGREFIIAGEPDPKWGEKVILKVAGPALSEPDRHSLLSGLRELLPPHERPARIDFVDSFPHTSSGKIVRGHSRH